MTSKCAMGQREGGRVERHATAAVVSAATLFTIVNTRPWSWVMDTTPTGGDLGAHVWAAAYLRDALLGELRLTGWTHDWYAGFPVFTFYMVIPYLLVVVVDAGLPLPLDLYGLVAVGAASAMAGRHLARRLPARWRMRAWIGGSMLVSAASLALGRLNGDTIGLGRLGGFTYSDTSVDRFLAAVVLPAALGRLAWNALPAKRRAGGERPLGERLRAAARMGRPHHRQADTMRPLGERQTPRVLDILPDPADANPSRLRLPVATAVVAATLLAVPMPYGVALKLVAISGVVLLPTAAYAMARIAGLAFPGPALAAVAALPFLFDRSHNIYGGNLMSTMAGEFAYSLGLACAVVYTGLAFRGMATGRHRVAAGILLALTGLTHLFSAFWALTVTVVMLAAASWRRGALMARLRWTTATGALAAALSAWWVLPFWWNRGMLNDMGWGKERRYLSALWSRTEFDYDFLTDDPPLKLFVMLAAAAVLISAIRFRSAPRSLQRSVRMTLVLACTAAVLAVLFRLLPESRLWNVRILPFYYLSVYLTALIGLAGVTRTLLSAAVGRTRPSSGGTGVETGISAAVAAAATLSVIVMVGLPLRGLPGGGLDDAGLYRWGPLKTAEHSLGPFWVQYNYEGYESREPTEAGGGYSEYRELIDTMAAVADEHGCGRSLWEYERGRLGSYGTPMAPMLLPYWTDGCIGSMEGLYFESSATTPYHFLMLSELAAAPSHAQRDLPYSNLDIVSGVEHLKLMGVRYYLAFSHAAVEQARLSADLTEVAASGPWAVFLVDGSDPVVALDTLPVVVEGMPASEDVWLEVAMGAFLAYADGGVPLLASDGPEGWPRMPLAPLADEMDASRTDGTRLGSPRERAMRRLAELLPEAAPLQAADAATKVSDVEIGNHSISFSVSRAGVPVLVRTSYFPNWSASGADGPYRVTPNLMVVVPTGTRVELSYGRSPVEVVSLLITVAGAVASVWLSRQQLRNRLPGLRSTGDGPADPAAGPAEPHGRGLGRDSGRGEGVRPGVR